MNSTSNANCFAREGNTLIPRINCLSLILLSTILGGLARAQCTGASPSWTSTPDQASVNTCINNASEGDTIKISAGSATWTTGVAISGKGLTIQGAGSGRIVAYSVTSNALPLATGALALTITSTNVANPNNLSALISTGQTLLVYELGFEANFLRGTVTSFNPSTGALAMNITSAGGTCGASGGNGGMNSNCKRWLVTTIPSTTIVNNISPSNGSANPLFTITEDTSFNTNISGIQFTMGTNGSQHFWLKRANGGQAILIHDCWMQQGGAGGFALINSTTNRGVIWNCSFDVSPWAQSNYAVFQIKDDGDGMPTSWTTPSTFGMNDAAGTAFCSSCSAGQNNFYFETNDVHGFLDWNNFDDNSRAVVRYNLFDNTGSGTHGADTSNYGNRHFEFYNNVGLFEGYKDGSTANLNFWLLIRGGTFVYHDNVLPAISSQDYGTKSDIDVAVEQLSRDAGPHPCWGTSPTIPGQYYFAPRQAGMGYVTGAGSTQGTQANGYFGPASHDTYTYVGDSEPMYIWNNTRTAGGSTTALNVNYATDNEGCSNEDSQSNYVASGRDFFNTASTAKPGYTPFTYPHPLTQGIGLTLPNPPTALQATVN